MLVDAKTISQQLGISSRTLHRLRSSNQLIEGVHFTKIGYRTLRYNLELMQHWAITRNVPGAHQRRIKEYLKTMSKLGKL